MIVPVRLVLDTSVIVAAMRSSRGASAQVVRAALERRFTLLLSVPLVLEYEAVLTRAEHLEEGGLGMPDIDLLLNTLIQKAEQVALSFRWRPAAKDPDDDMVLEAAINGGADGLVTFNQRDFGEVAGRFGIRVLSPKQAWEEVCGR